MRKYLAFLKVIECGSFTTAADELNYTQSAVSQMISTLEKELKTSLFIRSKFGLQLTREGEQLLPYINDLVDAYKNLTEKSASISGLESGAIKIATFGTLAASVLPDLFKSFNHDYPNILLETRQGHYREIEHWINKDMADFGITNVSDVKNFQVITLFKDPYYLIVPPGHKLQGEKNINAELLKNEVFVSLDEERDMEYLNVLKTLNVKLNVKYCVCDYFSIQAMVEKGLGVSLIPNLAYLSGRFNIERKSIEPPISREIGIIYKNKNQLSTPSQIFINYLTEYMKKYPYGEMFGIDKEAVLD